MAATAKPIAATHVAAFAHQRISSCCLAALRDCSESHSSMSPRVTSKSGPSPGTADCGPGSASVSLPMRTRHLNGLLIVAVLAISTAPLFAQGAQPDAAKLKADARNVVGIIGSDKA